jgi:hypothetical protein
MKNVRTLSIYTLALGFLGLVAYPLYAEITPSTTHAKLLCKYIDDNKVTLVDAITTAEEHCKGMALQAVAVTKDMGLQFEVYCLDGDKIMLVELNGKTGKVTKSSEVDELGMRPETKTAAIETKTTTILKEKVTDKP